MLDELKVRVNECQRKYRGNEAGMLILDFADANWNDYAWLVNDNVLPRACQGMDLMGLENVKLTCKTWSLARRLVESLGPRNALKITCVVPLDGFRAADKLMSCVPASFAARMPGCVELGGNIRAHADRLLSFRFHAGRLSRSKLVSAVVPMDRSDLTSGPQVAEELHRMTGLGLIIEPRVDPLGRRCGTVDLSWQELDALYQRVIDLCRSADRHDAYLMSLGMLPSRLLAEHPCNGYVCSGETCHSRKGNLPRRLALLADGTVVPESRFVNPCLAIGNIKSGRTIVQLLTGYANGEGHQLFLNTAKRIFLEWIQPCPFRVVPWTRLFEELSYDT